MNSLAKLARPAAESHAVAVAAAVRRRAPAGDCRQLRIRLYALLLLSDALFMACAFLLADFIRFGAYVGYGVQTFLVLLPIYVAVGFNGGAAWSIRALSSPRASASAATRALAFSICVATVVFFTLKVGEDFSRLVLGIGSTLSLVLIAAARIAIGKRIGDRYDWTFRREFLLLDGVRATANATESVIDARKLKLTPDPDDPAMLDRLARALDGSERVTVACPVDRRLAWARALAGANADVEILVPELNAIGARGLVRHGDTPALLVCSGPLRLRDRVVKRGFDVAVSGAALFMLSPLFLLVALAIPLESSGPALFRQVRMGRGNRLFTVL